MRTLRGAKARPIAFCLLLAFAPASLAVPRIAQAAGQDDAVTKAARARFQEGVADFDKGDFEAARAAFLEAYALKQHPAVLLNLAQSCLKSGHYLDAAKFFDKYLHDPQGDKKSDATRGLADARAKLGHLDITAPSGSEVMLDSTSVGRAPLGSAVDVEPGNHTVHVRLPDGTSSEQSVVVTAGQMQPVRFAAAATVVTPPANPPTNPENPPPTNPPPTNPPPENPPNNPPPNNPATETYHSTAGLALGIGGGVLAVAGFILTGVFAASKSSANDNYVSVGNQIAAAEKNDGSLPQNIRNNPTCNPPPSSTYTNPCAVLKSNQDAVNQDATAANTFAVIGVLGVLAAAGGFIWWAVPMHRTPSSARLSPWIAPGLGGLSLSGSF